MGIALGGATTAVVCVALGSLLLRPLLPEILQISLFALAFVLVAANEFGLRRLKLPQNARQVPPAIAHDGARLGALQFGFEMGTGVRTYMTSGLPHVLACGVLLLASWQSALVVGLAFGLGRAVMILGRRAHRDESAWDTSLKQWDKRIRLVLTATFAVPMSVLVAQLQVVA